MSDAQPIVFLEGHTTILRPYSEETDLGFFTRWMNDQRMLAFLGRNPVPLTTDQERDALVQLSTQENGVFLVLCDKESPETILGSMGLRGINFQNRNASTGALLGPTNRRGKGYGSDAKMALLYYAFHTLGLRNIGADVHSSNPRSLGSMHKCGYKIVGTRLEWTWRNGAWVDEIITQVTKEDFDAIYPAWKDHKKFLLDWKGNPRE